MNFPRVSPSGFAFLACYLWTAKRAFDASMYGESLRSRAMEASSSVALSSLVMATSLLNMASHSAVILGALNDLYLRLLDLTSSQE